MDQDLIDENTDQEEDRPDETSGFKQILYSDEGFKSCFVELLEHSLTTGSLTSSLASKLQEARINVDNIPFSSFCDHCLVVLRSHFNESCRPVLSKLIENIFLRVQVAGPGLRKNIYGKIKESDIDNFIETANVELEKRSQPLLSTTVDDGILNRKAYLKLRNSGGFLSDRYLIAFIYGWYQDDEDPTANKFDQTRMKSLVTRLYKKFHGVIRYSM